MSDRSKRDMQAGENRIGLTLAVLLLSFAATAALGTAVPAGLGLSFALWQSLAMRHAAPVPVPARARAARDRR